MKANNGTGNIPERDTWETPQHIYDALNEQYGFTYDCCSDGKNNKCNSYSSNFEMYVEVHKNIYWMNPPFSKACEMFKQFFNIVTEGVSIYRCDNLETSLWQEVILKNADWVFIPKGRISYEGKKGKGSRFPSALIGKGVDFPVNLNGFALKVVRTNE